MACSSTEVEYRALADTTFELVWLQWLLKNLDVFTSSTTPLYCDNQSAIHITHNDVFHERTKHVEINCDFIRYHLIHGALKLISISSKDQLANIFTNSHPLLLLFIVTTRVPFMLLTMMSSMNELNTSRSIIILFIIILFMVLSSWSQSPLKINLQISSPTHILRDAFVLWLITSSWSHIHLEFEGDCLRVLGYVGFSPTLFTCITHSFVLHTLPPI